MVEELLTCAAGQAGVFTLRGGTHRFTRVLNTGGSAMLSWLASREESGRFVSW
jgi:hypothetical protein